MKKKCMVYFFSLISFVFVLAGLVITNNAAAQNQMFVPEQVFTQNGVYSRYSLEVSPIHDPSSNLEISIIDERSAPGGFNKINPTDGSELVAPWSTSLEWSNSSSADIYAYCIDTTDDDICTENDWVSTGTATEVELSGLGLLPGTTYYWQVHARNTSGMTEADGGQWWSFTTVAPPPPEYFEKISPTNGAVYLAPWSTTLEWSTNRDANSYEYCYYTTNDNYCSTWISAGTATEVELTGLSPGTTYYWQVLARNYGGTTEADGGQWWSFTTVAPPPSDPPEDFGKISPSTGSTHIGDVTLEWSISSNADSYGYCYDTTDDDTCPDENWVSSGPAIKVVLSGLIPGTTYYWQVLARNADGTTQADGGSWWYFTTTRYYYLPLLLY